MDDLGFTLGAIVVALPIIILTLIIVIGTVIRLVKSFKHIYEPEKSGGWVVFHHKITPILISVICPVAGFVIASGCGTPQKYDDLIYTPVNHEHMMTIVVFYVVAVASYWLSRAIGEELSPLLKALTLLGMAQGFVLCVALAVQFGPMSLYGFFPVIITFPLLSPFLFAMLLFIEIRRQFHLFKKTALKKEEDVVYDSLILNVAEKSIVKNNFLESPAIFALLIPFVAIQQTTLILFGQRPDSFIKAFAETCTYTFSQLPEPPHPGTGHYLCTIASRGDVSLVKPLRKGWRGEGVIDVNRQLLIANAFEEWLEEYTPIFHRYLRRFYTIVAKPMNDAVRSRRISNTVFILMKPLEWSFLFWLYLVDTSPENRIHCQYLGIKDVKHWKVRLYL